MLDQNWNHNKSKPDGLNIKLMNTDVGGVQPKIKALSSKIVIT